MNTTHLELDSIRKHYAQELCELPKCKNVIGTKWVYMIKRQSDANIDYVKTNQLQNGQGLPRALWKNQDKFMAYE